MKGRGGDRGKGWVSGWEPRCPLRQTARHHHHHHHHHHNNNNNHNSNIVIIIIIINDGLVASNQPKRCFTGLFAAAAAMPKTVCPFGIHSLSSADKLHTQSISDREMRRVLHHI